jgi:hypothetical protein
VSAPYAANDHVQAPSASPAEAALADTFGPVIHAYTRAQAIADEVLHDVTTDAAEAGFLIPVALTDAAWRDAVAWNDENIAPQDEHGRLWDVLSMARWRARAASDGERVLFQVLRVPTVRRRISPSLTDLVLHIGPGDHGEPVMTIMRPDED